MKEGGWDPPHPPFAAAQGSEAPTTTMAAVGHQKMRIWKTMTTGQEVEGPRPSTTRATVQEG